MDLQLTGRRALVTGSSSGIGAAIARMLAEEGCKVVVHGHSVAFKPEEFPSSDRPSRIGIDTGAYATEQLTCLALVGAMRSWIHTEQDPRFA